MPRGYNPTMPADRPIRTPPRNRLAKPLPDRWRTWLVAQGVPRRKYTAVVAATLTDGRTVDDVVIEEGWIIALGTAPLAAAAFEQPIALDPAAIASLRLVQTV